MARLYVNGRAEETTRSPRGSPGASFFIGGGNAGNTKGKGIVDDVRVYNAAPDGGACLFLWCFWILHCYIS